MTSLSKYFLISIGEDIDVGRVLGPTTTFVKSAYALRESEQPAHLRLPAALRILVRVEPAKRQRRVFNFFSRTRGLDVRQCTALSVAAAAVEYAGKTYTLVLGGACAEVETLPQDPLPHATSAAVVRVSGDEVARAFERLQRVEAEANHSYMALFSQIEEERSAHRQTREVLLELVYVCGENLGQQESALAMALAVDCFMLENNSSALPCCADTVEMIQHAIHQGQLQKLSFRRTMQVLNEGTMTEVWGVWMNGYDSTNPSPEDAAWVESPSRMFASPAGAARTAVA